MSMHFSIVVLHYYVIVTSEHHKIYGICVNDKVIMELMTYHCYAHSTACEVFHFH
jgi:hypothetical protein